MSLENKDINKLKNATSMILVVDRLANADTWKPLMKITITSTKNPYSIHCDELFKSCFTSYKLRYRKLMKRYQCNEYSTLAS